ncbi:MAG: MBL fold metallo-hydrolase [Sphingobacteriales bacterium]|nr:MAG: MBL fold metallo-hydrolase [Sphingobacteriales bacterium]
MKLSFHGAAKTVTGSKHLITLRNGTKILLDCGLFQGLGRETIALNKQWGFEPSEIDYVILSHAHIDHVGLLPKLRKDGFDGQVFCTPQTAELAFLLMRDSAHIQEMEATLINRTRQAKNKSAISPLYTDYDVQELIPMFKTVTYEEPYSIDGHIAFQFTEAGHILGSASVHLTITEEDEQTTIAFSGDIGRYNDMILRSPATFPKADYVIMESTYGNNLHDVLHPATDKILNFINKTCIEKGGKLIIPAFSVGRTQEILYLLNRLETENRLPKTKYYVDSPLSMEATAIMKAHPECFNDQVQQLLQKDDDVFAFEGLHYIESVEESISLSTSNEPCVIISASGMAESGRVKHHIAQNISSDTNSILLVGYCEASSLGGQLHNGAKNVQIFGDSYEVRASVYEIDSMSAHGDYDDLCRWISCQDNEKVKAVFLVHGEGDTQLAFKDRLLRKGFANVQIPELHETFPVGTKELASNTVA